MLPFNKPTLPCFTSLHPLPNQHIRISFHQASFHQASRQSLPIEASPSSSAETSAPEHVACSASARVCFDKQRCRLLFDRTTPMHYLRSQDRCKPVPSPASTLRCCSTPIAVPLARDACFCVSWRFELSCGAPVYSTPVYVSTESCLYGFDLDRGLAIEPSPQMQEHSTGCVRVDLVHPAAER